MKVKIIAPSSDEVSPSIRSQAKLMPNVVLIYLAALAPQDTAASPESGEKSRIGKYSA